MPISHLKQRGHCNYYKKINSFILNKTVAEKRLLQMNQSRQQKRSSL